MIDYIIIGGAVVFGYFILMCIGQTILLIASFPDIMRRFDEIRFGNVHDLINNEFCIPITIIMPCYNMGDILFESIQSVLNSDYNDLKVIVVNDGSTNDCLQRMIDRYELYQVPLVIKERIKTSKLRGLYESKKDPRLTVIDKEHGPAGNGADSVNAGINACRTPVYLTFDTDTIMEKDALTRIMFSFIARAHCIIVGGGVYVNNDNPIKDGAFVNPPRIPKNWVAAEQVCEYFRSFLFGRAGWTPFGGTLCYAGAFTLFETEIVRQIGGYDNNNFGYDAEIVLHLHHYMRQKKFPYTVDFTPGATSWTEVPSTLKSFWKQRDFWQRGLLRGFWTHKAMFFNPRYGVIGLITYPYFLFFEILAPLIELVSYSLVLFAWIYGIFHIEILILFFAVAIGYVGFLTIAVIMLNLITFNKYSKWSDMIEIFLLSLSEIIFFRQFLTLAVCYGTVHYLVRRLMGKPC